MRPRELKLLWNTVRVPGPDWSSVESKLEAMRTSRDVLTLQTLDPAGRVSHLQLRADSGRYLLTLGEEKDDDYVVRSLATDSTTQVQVDILGDSWDSRMVTTDFELVKSVFRQYFDTGNVSSAILA